MHAKLSWGGGVKPDHMILYLRQMLFKYVCQAVLGKGGGLNGDTCKCQNLYPTRFIQASLCKIQGLFKDF